ncbi:MAG: hypothetical protein Roseis2KO_44310 [Roseivirga sp.]
MIKSTIYKTAGRKIKSAAESLQTKETEPGKTVIQAKLKIGQSNDKYEQEADRVADQVVNSKPVAKSGIQKKSAVHGTQEAGIQKSEEEEIQPKHSPDIMRMEEEEAQPRLQMQREEELQTKKNTGDGSRVASPTVENTIRSSKGQGSTMDKGTRSLMEKRIGADFGHVRIHTGSTAHDLNARLNAQAFTVGNDVYFDKAKYNPGTRSGQHLLAHELTHVVQQKGNIQPRVQKQDKPKKVKGTASPQKTATVISEEIRKKIVAIALAEAYHGQDSSIASIYLNLYKKDGDKGLKKSAAYSHKSDNYKIYMTVLGDQTYANDKPRETWLTVIDAKTKKERKAKTIKEYTKHNGYFKSRIKGTSRAQTLKATLDGWISNPTTQPHKGWLGQGNLNDINNVSSQGIYWTRARAYFWVQKNDAKAAKYLEVLKAGKNSQFIFDSLAIQKYYQKHKLPASVKKIQISDL